MKIEEQKAKQALLNCLKEVPFIRAMEVESSLGCDRLRPDFIVEVALHDGEQLLLVEVKSNGQPRLVREAANQLYRLKEFFPNAYGVIIAPYVSPSAAEICHQEGIGYVDLAGNCFLSFNQVFIRQDGRPNPFSQRRDLRKLYSPKAERVLRVLLARPGERWKLQALSREAKVSLGQVSNVKRALSDREWIDTGVGGFCLKAPESLVAEWAQNYNYRRNNEFNFYSIRTATEVELTVADICKKEGLNYALTGFSGAARIAPAVRYQRAFIYVERHVYELARLLNLKEVSSGANVSLLEPYDEGVFYGAREFEGIRTVSPIQIYLDLQGFRGRGQEAARVLLNEVIKPKW